MLSVRLSEFEANPAEVEGSRDRYVTVVRVIGETRGGEGSGLNVAKAAAMAGVGQSRMTVEAR